MIKTTWWSEKIHISWFFTALSLGLLTGIGVAKFFDAYLSLAPVIVVSLVLLVLGTMSRKRVWIVSFLVVGMSLGFARGTSVRTDLNQYQPYLGKLVILQGTVNEDVSIGPKGDQRLRLTDVSIGSMDFAGTVWVSLNERNDIKRGDVIRINGLLSEGFGTATATVYRADIETISRPNPGDIGRRARDWFAKGLYRSVPQDDADFALAFLLGQKIDLSDDLADQLRTIGLVHAIVASGYHLTVLVGVIRRFFVRISKYLTLILSLGIVIGFIMITGLSPSMTRAGIVTLLALLAWYYGRRFHPVVLISVTAAITAVYNPQYTWGDLGWYLSFTSFIGVLILAPLFEHYFFGDKQRSFWREIGVVTIAAQLLTLPITIAAFGYFSIYAVLANLLVVPIVPLIMLLAFLVGVIALLIPALADLIGYLLSGVLWYVVHIVQWIAGLPAAKTEVAMSVHHVLVSYLILGIVITLLHGRTHHNFRSDQTESYLF